MSTTGITNTMSSMFQQFQSEFQQLGKDLSSENLSAAQSDFATLEQDLPQGPNATTSSSQENNPIAEAFNQLSQDLQSGNLSAAQQDYSTIQQDFQDMSSQMTHHHHYSGGSQGTQESQFAQLFAQLGQDLQSGNLSSAQPVFTSLQNYLQSNSSSGTSSGSTYTGLSVNA